MVNQHGRYQSIYGMPPNWGPEFVPPQTKQPGEGDHEPFPDVHKNWPYHPDAQIPLDWMWYRKTKGALDWKKDWEPTIYLDTLTLQPTTRTAMLERASDDMLGALDMGMERARQQVQDEIDGQGAFGELQQGFDAAGHDMMQGMAGEDNSDSDPMARHRMPKVDMGHTVQHGRHFMRLESKDKREKRTNMFTGPSPVPVDTYLGTLWKAKNPLVPDNQGISFG